MRAAVACVAGMGGLLLACARPAPAEPALDATAQKLKALAEAPVRPPPRGDEDPNARLTERTTRGVEAEPSSLPLPRDNPTAWTGSVALKLVNLSTSAHVRSGRIQLVTDESFLLVTLLAQNVGKQAARVDLSTARLLLPSGAAVRPAPDAQRLVGTVPGARTLEPGGEEVREDWVLVFELPETALTTGLTLSLGDAALRLR